MRSPSPQKEDMALLTTVVRSRFLFFYRLDAKQNRTGIFNLSMISHFSDDVA